MKYQYEGPKTIDQFIEEVAEDCYKKLSEEDKEYIYDHPFAIDYHFTYCLYIRNQYIYDNLDKFDFEAEPDDLSGSIMIRIIGKVTRDNLKGVNDLFLYRLYSHKEFMELRKKLRESGKDSGEIIRKYAKKADCFDYTHEAICKMLGTSVIIETTMDDNNKKFMADNEKKEAVIAELIKELEKLLQI